MAKWDAQKFVGLHDVPPDPIYLAFAEGLFKADDDLGDQWRWRWSPHHNRWFTYPITGWILESVGIPDTPLPFNFRFQSDEADPLDFGVTIWLPDLFRKVQATFTANSARWPSLVWGLHGGGDWQNATERPTLPPELPQPGAGKKVELSQECLKRVADVRAFEARGDISSAQAAKMIDQIVHE
jgi:hypothetical protein